MATAPEPSITTTILITAGPSQFLGILHPDLAPQTCALFLSLLPYTQNLIHVRWSGEGLWIPLGFGTPSSSPSPSSSSSSSLSQFTTLPLENHTSHPAPGHLLLYPGGISETEFLWAYGGVSFASKMGPLAGNHFLSVVEGMEGLRKLGERVLWEGKVGVRFERATGEMIEKFREEQRRAGLPSSKL